MNRREHQQRRSIYKRTRLPHTGSLVLLLNICKRHSLFLIICFVFMGLPKHIMAQVAHISGYVYEAQTGKPLPAATVYIAGTNTGASTDSTGYYSLTSHQSNITLVAQFMGFQQEKQQLHCPLNSETKANFLLKDRVRALDGIMVTAKSKARALRESAMPISVLTSKQIQGTASSINDVLARTVGVTVRNTGGIGSASRISVRGLEGKRMGLFVDEAPIGQMNNFVSLNDIPTSMIERIEIYKGLVPYKFGGSALGGAVNVVIKEYPPFYLDASYEVGSFNTHQLSSVIKRTLKDSGIQFGLGGAYTYSDNNYPMRLINIDDRWVKRNHDKFRKTIIGGSLMATKWWFDEIKLELVYSNTNQQVQGIDRDIREAYNFSESFLSGLIIKKKDFFLDGLDLDWESAINWGRYGLVDKATVHYDWDGNKSSSESPFGGELGKLPSDANNHSIDALLKCNLAYTLNNQHSLNLNIYAGHTLQKPHDPLMDKTLGYSVNFPSYLSSITLGLSHDLSLFQGKLQNAFTLKGFFFRSHAQALETFSIKAPIPYDVYKNFWGFNDGLKYQINPQWLVKGSFNSEVRIPTSEELIGNGYSILPSPALRPERTTGFNLGILSHRDNRYGLFEGEVNIFYNILHDMVRFTPDIIPTMARYRNFGDVKTMGVECDIKCDISKHWYLYANATYQDLRDIRDTYPGTEIKNPTLGKRIPNVPYLLGNIGLEYHHNNLFGGSGQNTRFLYDASYIHQYYYDFEVSIYQDRKIPSTLTMDMGIEHSWGNGRWTLTAKVKNMLDKEIFSEFNRPLPGRNIAIKLRYLFK